MAGGTITGGKLRAYGQARDRLRASVVTPAEELIAAAEAIIADLRAEIATLESLRPHWAQGYTSDGVAAQVATAALSDMWDALGVNNQTAAMARLREMLR